MDSGRWNTVVVPSCPLLFAGAVVAASWAKENSYGFLSSIFIAVGAMAFGCGSVIARQAFLRRRRPAATGYEEH